MNNNNTDLLKFLRSNISDLSRPPIYLVLFRVIKNKDVGDVLVYHTLSYPYIFRKMLVLYLVYNKNYEENILKSEFGDIAIFIESSIYQTQIKNDFNDYGKDFLKNLFVNRPNLSDIEFINVFRKFVLHLDVNGLSDIVSYGFKKEYESFFKMCFTLDKTIPFNLDNYFLLNYCVFLVEDVNVFVNNLKSKGVVVNMGPQPTRGYLNSMDVILSYLDISFRDYLCSSFKDEYNIYGDSPILKKKFSFKNVHMKLGKVRYYSTSNRPQNYYISKRNKLFQENYKLVNNILVDSNYILSEDVQKEIELLLSNQENIFNKSNKNNINILYNSKSYDFIISKKLDIIKYLDQISLVSNVNQHSTEFIPWVIKFRDYLGTNIISNILLSYFMEVLSKEFLVVKKLEYNKPGVPTITASNDIGEKIVRYYIYKHYKSFLTERKKCDEEFDITLSEYKELYKNDFTDFFEIDNFPAKVGGHFMGCFFTVDLLREDIDKDPENKKEAFYCLRVQNYVRDILLKDNTYTYHLPQKLPMVVEPNDYVFDKNKKNITKLGGYLLNDSEYTESLIKDRIGHDKSTTLEEDNLIVDMVNGLSKVPFKINVDTLEFIYKYGYEKEILIDDDNIELRNFIRKPYKFSKDKNNDFKSLISKIQLERNIISIADIYSNVSKIYFPVRLDFRGRINCISDYFNYQKNDLAKGLLLFSTPGVLTKFSGEGINYFKGYGASLFSGSLEKKSLSYRVKWIDDNQDLILNFEQNDIINKSENKVCFVSFCFEYKRFIEFWDDINSNMFYTYLPIQLDASCNGYQHLCLLTRETKHFDKLNLGVSNSNDEPADFYTFIQDKVDNYIEDTEKFLPKTIKDLEKKVKSVKKDELEFEKTNKIINKFKNELNSLKKLNNIRFGRSIIKKVIMIESYSAGFKKLVDTIADNLKVIEKDVYQYGDSSILITRNDLFYYIGCLRVVLERELPKVRDLSKYLDKIAVICTKVMNYIPWTTPSGLDIKQSYLKDDIEKIPAFTFTKSKYTFKKYLKGEYDLPKQQRALRPNFIHTFDAATIALLYKNLDGKILYTVHDCFAVTADKVEVLKDHLKSTYLKMYTEDTYLLNFDKYVRDSIKQIDRNAFDKEGKNITFKYKNKNKTVPFPDITKIIKNKKSNKDMYKFGKSFYIIN